MILVIPKSLPGRLLPDPEELAYCFQKPSDPLERPHASLEEPEFVDGKIIRSKYRKNTKHPWGVFQLLFCVILIVLIPGKRHSPHIINFLTLNLQVSRK